MEVLSYFLFGVSCANVLPAFEINVLVNAPLLV